MQPNRVKANRILWKGAADGHSGASELLVFAGDVAMIVRGRPRALLMLCPCGCGEVLTINLDSRSDKAWLLYKRNAGVSLYPSVWRTTGCKSHFVVWDDRIFGLGLDWWDEDDSLELDSGKVLEMFSGNAPTHFTKIAEQLNAVPWEVLRICRRLAREKKLVAGELEDDGNFCRPKNRRK